MPEESVPVVVLKQEHLYNREGPDLGRGSGRGSQRGTLTEYRSSLKLLLLFLLAFNVSYMIVSHVPSILT